MQVKLTEKQLFTICNALRVASERYADDAKLMHSSPGHAGLAPQFERQVSECNELCEELESL